MMDGVLGEMELAALPCCPRQHGAPGGLEAGVIVGGDEADAMEAALGEILQEAAPMHLRFRERAGDAKDVAALVEADADRRQDRAIPDDAADAHLFVTGIEQQIGDAPKRPLAPGFQFLVQQFGGAADLAGGQTFQAELGHHRLDVPGRNALDIHLGDGQHDRPAGAPAPLQRLRIEGRHVAGALRHLHADRAAERVQLFQLAAVAIATALG